MTINLATWSVEIFTLLLPPGMIGVIADGDDGYGGLLGWMWVVSALTTVVLIWVTRLALREKYYSAVMAGGLLYLAILTAFGTDVVAARCSPRQRGLLLVGFARISSCRARRIGSVAWSFGRPAASFDRMMSARPATCTRTPESSKTSLFALSAT